MIKYIGSTPDHNPEANKGGYSKGGSASQHIAIFYQPNNPVSRIGADDLFNEFWNCLHGRRIIQYLTRDTAQDDQQWR